MNFNNPFYTDNKKSIIVLQILENAITMFTKAFVDHVLRLKIDSSGVRT